MAVNIISQDFMGGNLFDTSSLYGGSSYDLGYGGGTLGMDIMYDYGGGGGGGSVGGAGNVSIVRGCMDPSSLTYNPRATVDDGSCRYDIPEQPIKDKRLILKLLTNVKDASILIDGQSINKNAPTSLEFSSTELLTPKRISLKTANGSSKETYLVFSKKQTIKTEIKPIIDILPPKEDIINQGIFTNPLNGFDSLIPTFGGFENPQIKNIGGTPLELTGFSNTSVKQVYLGYTPPLQVFEEKTKPELILGNISFDYYSFVIQRESVKSKVFDDDLLPFTTLIEGNDRLSTVATANLQFSLEQDVIDIVVNPTNYSVDIVTSLTNVSRQSIRYETSWGDSGIVQQSGTMTLSVNDVPNPTVKFFANGIPFDTTRIIYKSSTQEVINFDPTFNLVPGNQTIIISSENLSVPLPNQPTINAQIDNTTYNINSDEPLRIPYNTVYADEVILQLGNTKRKIESNGSLVLSKSDFYQGVGTYTLYLQPVSAAFGTGEYKKIIINVISKAFLPGPDITHINYPQNIKGADFKEYDVPFKISWQSVNTNYIHIFAGKRDNSHFLGKFPNSGVAEFTVENVLTKSGQNLDYDADLVQFSLVFVPFNEEGDELTEGKEESIKITFDKGDLKLRRGSVISDLRSAFLSGINTSSLIKDTSPFLTHYLHLGDGKNKLISTWGIDDLTFSEEYRDEETNQIKYRNIEKSLVLKLYEPLPRDINANDTVWISKIQSIPLIDEVELIEDSSTKCIPLTPNFDLDVSDSIGYQILDDLIASGSESSAELVNQFVSSSGLSLSNLSINFVTSSTQVIEEYSGSGNIKVYGEEHYNWKDFVKYSSAEERVANFFYKVQLIETYQDKISEIESKVSTVSLTNEKSKVQTKINDVKKGFDAFEKYLYTTSGSLTYPGAGQNQLSASTDDASISWYNSIIGNKDSEHSAVWYDYNNPSRISYNLPEHIKLDDKNGEFILFFDMVGQHFDILWTHIKGLQQSKKLEHKFDKGITNDLIYHMLESLGFNADFGGQSQTLWEYAFGYWNKNKNERGDGSSKSILSSKDRQQEVWRRLLNNLPYLYKNKGTKRAVHAALSCYGIPASLLTIMEFGGPNDSSQDKTTKYTFQDRTASINISGSAAITIPWKRFNNSLSNDYPNSVEIRLNTETKQNQQIISGSEWSLNILKDTGSLAKIELVVGTQSSSTDVFPFFNDEYTQIVVNRVTGSTGDSFVVYAKEGFQERIRNEATASLSATTKAWTSGSEIKIGGSDFDGKVDEFRLWRTPLSEGRIENHTLLPDAIDGNHVSASTHDLILRHDFEYPKNRHTSGDVDIKNVALTTTYCTSSVASGFINESSYPYQYTPYDRDVTATVPSTGFGYANKVRFEEQTKILDLSYNQRATKKSFDQSPLDSNRLGLFFSPIKEINMDILKSLGNFNIDNYIGNPQDEYSHEYSDLRRLRNYYFSRYTLNLHEYIQLVRYIDKSLFNTLESLVPARAKVSSGLLIEPHILERSKTKWKRPVGEKKDFEGVVRIEDDVVVTSTRDQYDAFITASEDTILSGDNSQWDVTIDTDISKTLVAEKSDYEGTYTFGDETAQYGFITVNSGSDMGGISITINAQITGSVQGQYDSTQYQQIGLDLESLGVAGFGLYGSGSHSIRTRLFNNNIVKDRVRVYLLKESYTEDVPQNIDSNDSSRGMEIVTTTKYRTKVNVIPFEQSGSLPSVGGNIVGVTPLNGYFPLHYRNTSDLTTGLENSFFNGSKQTAATTLDGGSPVQTFTTNPNTLRVSDSGRGSGEPILEVD
jgi:hypothetical protein